MTGSSHSGSGEFRAQVSSPDAERALLGGLMLDNEAWDDIADLVTAGDFSRDDHRMIFQAIGELIHDGKHCDNLTVCEHLRARAVGRRRRRRVRGPSADRHAQRGQRRNLRPHRP